MQNININLAAGQSLPVQVQGLVLQIISTGEEAVEVKFLQGSRVMYDVDGVATGWRLKPQGGFNSLVFTAGENATTVQAIVTNGDIDIQVLEVGSSISNTADNPVPVSLVNEPGAPVPVSAPAGNPVNVAAPAGAPVNVAVQGTVNVSGATLTATNVGIDNTAADPVPVQTAISSTVATVATVPVAAGATGTVLLAADATRRGVRFYNPQSSAGPVALTPDNVTSFANAAIVLYPGDYYAETDAPAAAWYAATPAGTTAAVNLQTVHA
jgi:hypothetical protein